MGCAFIACGQGWPLWYGEILEAGSEGGLSGALWDKAFLEEESECKGSEAGMCLGHLGKSETSVAGAECNCHPSSQIDGCSKMSV